MMGKLKFAEIARKANKSQQVPQEENNKTENNGTSVDQVQPTLLPPQLIPEKVTISNDNDQILPNREPEKPSFVTKTANDDAYVMDEAYFIPAPTLKEKAMSRPTKPIIRKMSGFTRMNSYAKKNLSMTDDPVDCLTPLMDNSSNDTKSTGVSSVEGNNNEHATEEKSRFQHPFLKRKFTEATDPRKLKENPLARRGVVIDPYQQKNIRLKLKTRLRKIVEERLTVKQIFSRYVEDSTLHGFLYTCSDTFLLRRLLWACLMILGAIYFLVKLREGIIEYFDYPFSTLSTIDFPDELVFPAISFCLVNSYKENNLNSSKFKPLYQDSRFPLQLSWKDPGYDFPGEQLLEELNSVSFQPGDVFEECDWIKRNTDHPDIRPNVCNVKNFTNFFNNMEEKCFTLNSGQEGHPLLKVSHNGLQYGYEALFDMRSDEAFQLHPYTGLKVYIHSQHEPPGLGSSFLLSPGFYYYVKMDMHETINLEPPYGTECGETKLKYFNDTYNQKLCLLEKLTDHVGELCGCREPYMALNGMRPCSMRETIMCSFPAKDSFNELRVRKECPIDCTQHHYLYQVTEARYAHNPPIGLQEKILENQNEKKNRNTSHLLELVRELSTEELQHYIEDNLIKVIFFYGEIEKQIHTQEATFDFYQFLDLITVKCKVCLTASMCPPCGRCGSAKSNGFYRNFGDMGGEIGLMLGASLLTFVEFIDLMIFLVYNQFLRLYKKKKIDDIFDEEDEQGEVDL